MYKEVPTHLERNPVAKMTDEHKRALAEGRRQSRAVKNYLEALEAESDASRVNEETLRKRLAKVQQQLEDEENPAKRVELVQQRLDIQDQLDNLDEAPDMDELEKGFRDVVVGYSERKGISYKAWREVGVPAGVLRDAGMKRSA
jgi:regulator of replication initiation timing